MKHIKNVIKHVDILEKYTCDCCAMQIFHDDLEEREMLHINYIGGYASIFGDGAEINLDLCQHCAKIRLGDILKIT